MSNEAAAAAQRDWAPLAVSAEHHPFTVLSEEPFIRVWHQGESLPISKAISQLQFGQGVIAVSKPFIGRYPQAYKCTILAAAGLSNEGIGSALHLTENTVKTHLQRRYAADAIRGRDHIPRRYLELGCIALARLGKPLEASDEEVYVLERISYGWSNKEVGSELGVAPTDIKTDLERLSRKNKLTGRVQLVMAGLLSGQIKYSPKQRLSTAL